MNVGGVVVSGHRSRENTHDASGTPGIVTGIVFWTMFPYGISEQEVPVPRMPSDESRHVNSRLPQQQEEIIVRVNLKRV